MKREMREVICADCGRYESECKCGDKRIKDWQKYLEENRLRKVKNEK